MASDNVMVPWDRNVTGELRVGDIVEVGQFRIDGIVVREEWLLAQIINIDGHQFGVRFVNDSTRLQMLLVSERGRMWR